MDFLDPVKRRRHNRRLITGYILTAVLILLIVRFFVIWASGETFNPRTGKITEYGLLFVDSKPSGANIYLNGQAQSTTSARLNLPAGNYDLVIKKPGYLDWENELSLPGQGVERIIYPMLFPKEIKPKDIKHYPALPQVVSESQDSRWLLIEQSTGQGGFSFDEYDTTKPTDPPISLSLPSGLLANSEKPNQALSIVSWADDNNHLLLEHSFTGGSEFLIYNRADPSSSINLNRQFNINPTAADFNNGRADQIFLFNHADNTVNLANTSRNNLTNLLSDVISWRAIGNNLIFYSTSHGAPSGQINFEIFDSGKSYKLTSLPAGPNYLFNAGNYQSNWYYALSSDANNRVIVYKNPLDSLKDSSPATPLLSLANPSAPKLSLSKNSRFIASQSGLHFNIYDTETETRYQYTAPPAVNPSLSWMDGNRLIGLSNGNIFVMDFDAQNQHQLIPTAGGSVSFDNQFNHMYSFGPAASDGSVNLQLSDLRAGADLPKSGG